MQVWFGCGMSRSRKPRRRWPRSPSADEKRIEAGRYRSRERRQVAASDMPKSEPTWYRYNMWNWD
jgi:hypothetical protein